MTRRLFNWGYPDVTQFLREQGFTYYKPHRGSHERWAKFKDDGTIERIVEVNRSHTAYPPKTLKRVIGQSGIGQDDWIKWANS
jgi:predicted RNA binding protein YcfA (HicA-like mRNA interferase family)